MAIRSIGDHLGQLYQDMVDEKISPEQYGEELNRLSLDKNTRNLYEQKLNDYLSSKEDISTNSETITQSPQETATNVIDETDDMIEESNEEKSWEEIWDDYVGHPFENSDDNTSNDQNRVLHEETDEIVDLPSPEELNGEINNESLNEIKKTFSGAASSIGTYVSSVKNNLSNAFNNVKYDSDEISVFLAKLKNLLEVNMVDIKNAIKNSINQLNGSINIETKNKLSSNSVDELYYFLLNQASFLIDKINNIKSYIELVRDGKINVDEETGPDENVNIPIIPVNNGGSGERRSRSHRENQESPPVEEIPVEEQEQAPQEEKPSTEEPPAVEEITVENQNLITASLGSLVFQTSIPLYETIGGEQLTSSIETEYGLLAINKVENVFYYKLIDKKTGKIYYANASDVSFEMEGSGVIHTKDNALVLNSTDIGADNNFVKLAEADSYYLMTENQEINGINFATILDSENGSSYYIPISDSVEVLSFNQMSNQITTEGDMEGSNE